MTRAMKDSGIEWIGKIPEDWNIEYSKRAFQVDKNIAGSQADEYPRLSLSNQGVIERSKYTGGGESPADYATYQIIPEGEFVFNFMGLEQDSVYRRVGIAPISGLVSAGYMKAIHNPKVINAQYGYYFFRFMEQDQLFKPYGTGIRSNLNKQQFLSIPLLLPPLSEQEKIASILDEKVARIDAIIADTKQSIEELKKYKQSLITETVTKGLDKDVPMKDSDIEWIGEIPADWEVVKLKRLGKADNGVTYKPHDETDSSRGRLVLRSSNIQNGKLSLQDNVYIDKGVADNKLLYQNDILICSRNGSKKLIGKNILVTENEKYAFGAFMMRFKPFSGVNARYIQYILHSNIFDFYLGSFLTSTINQLTVSNFYNIIIALPSNSVEQNQIVEFLDTKTAQIDKLIQDKEVLIEQYEKYKKSMIYEYVTGKREI